jgi:hypothetical protein
LRALKNSWIPFVVKISVFHNSTSMRCVFSKVLMICVYRIYSLFYLSLFYLFNKKNQEMKDSVFFLLLVFVEKEKKHNATPTWFFLLIQVIQHCWIPLRVLNNSLHQVCIFILVIKIVFSSCVIVKSMLVKSMPVKPEQCSNCQRYQGQSCIPGVVYLAI